MYSQCIWTFVTGNAVDCISISRTISAGVRAAHMCAHMCAHNNGSRAYDGGLGDGGMVGGCDSTTRTSNYGDSSDNKRTGSCTELYLDAGACIPNNVHISTHAFACVLHLYVRVCALPQMCAKADVCGGHRASKAIRGIARVLLGLLGFHGKFGSF